MAELRVSLQYEYRHYDDEEIKDVDEGKSTTIQIQNGSFTATCPEELPESMKGLVGWCEGFLGTPVTIENNTIFSEINVPNVYMYCLTTNPSKAVMEKFGYDACVEILNIEVFTSGIVYKLHNKGLLVDDLGLHHECIYKDRLINHSDRVVQFDGDNGEVIELDVTYFLKDPKYVHQMEHRLLWLPKINDDNLKPEIIKVPLLTQVMRKYEF